MDTLTGNPRRLLKIISKRYKHNKPINSDEIITLFTNIDELEEDLIYLQTLKLIDRDSEWNYFLTTQGRTYFKTETINSFEIVIKSIICPVVVAFFTTLITLWLKDS